MSSEKKAELTDSEIEELTQLVKQRKEFSTGRTNQERFEELQRLEEKMGRFPTTGDIKREGELSMTSFRQIGDWNDVKEAYQEWKE